MSGDQQVESRSQSPAEQRCHEDLAHVSGLSAGRIVLLPTGITAYQYEVIGDEARLVGITAVAGNEFVVHS